jgi:ATP-dependent DNA helicase RecQ
METDSKKLRAAPGAAQRPRADEADSFDPDLFEALRKKRKALADEANLPPYAIFHDRTLREMALYCPRDREGLLSLYGVGKSKLEKYADAFLEIIREHRQTSTAIAINWPLP